MPKDAVEPDKADVRVRVFLQYWLVDQGARPLAEKAYHQ